VGGASVAAARLLGLEHLARPGAAARHAPSGTDWISPLAAEPARVAHLLRRATFGATPQQLEQAISDGYAKTVDRLLETKPALPVDFLHGDPAQAARLNVGQLQQWWVDHILTTQTPFAERMTLFLHGHFTSDFRKVGVQTPFIYWQNLTWREMALTDLRSMLMKVTIDPAMLRYLDLATSTGNAPNENYSRELMELFTMGPGNYSEDDVRAAAKALAGWMLPKPTSSVEVVLDPKNNVKRTYPTYATPVPGYLDPKRAYNGSLTFLGRTAKFDTQAVIDAIVAKPATATFITSRVMAHFVGPQANTGFVNRVAAKFRASKYDMKTLMREVFMAPEFVAGSSYRALVKSPVEFMVHTLRALDASQLGRLVVSSGAGMGQVMFDPPDVGGWPNNEAWISSNSVVARVNFVSSVLAAMKTLPPADKAHQQHLDGVLGTATAGVLNQSSDARTRWFGVLASPEFQLK
jgi:uncharacterized protein (DUF1800 family)